MIWSILGTVVVILIGALLISLVFALIASLGRRSSVYFYILAWSVFLAGPAIVSFFLVGNASIDWIVSLCSILGSSVALAMAGLLKFKRVFPARQHYPEISTPVTRSPSGLPAAASSLLFAKGRAPIASIVEMCQRGTLHIEAVAAVADGQMDYFTYRLTVRDRTRYPWEQTFCRAIPTMAVYL